MDRDYSYTYHKLYGVIESLSVGQGDIRERLKNAYSSFHVLWHKEDFPDDLLKEWQSVIKDMTKYKAEYEGEGDLDCTMRKIKNKTGQKIARKIFHIWEQIHKFYYNDF